MDRITNDQYDDPTNEGDPSPPDPGFHFPGLTHPERFRFPETYPGRAAIVSWKSLLGKYTNDPAGLDDPKRIDQPDET